MPIPCLCCKNHTSKKRAMVEAGGAGRDRTGDLLNANQALSQLSYSPFSRSETIYSRPIGRALVSDQQKPAQNKGSNSQINSSGDPDTRATSSKRSARSVKGNGCHLLNSPVQTVSFLQ